MPKTFQFDEAYWSKIIQRPDWYMQFVPYVRETHKKLKDGDTEQSEFNKTIRVFFEKALKNGQVALGDRGPNLDKERQPIDTIVIHHTSGKPGYRLDFMEATQLLNIYATYYYQPRDEREKSLKGQPIWSNHFRNGKQTFLAYHWLMRMDGSFERLLDDDKIGWHAGNWDINKRSVAICLDNDYENQDPSDDVLRKLAAHIRANYPHVMPPNIIGHREARKGTECPGNNFLGGWKDTLVKYVTDGY